MTHPFFDSDTYPWHLPEAVLLHERLYKLIERPAEIDRTYKMCAEGLPPLALGAPPLSIWQEALENLAARPGALRNLCEQPFPYPSLQSAIQAVKDAKAQPLSQEQVTAQKNRQAPDDSAGLPDGRTPAAEPNRYSIAKNIKMKSTKKMGDIGAVILKNTPGASAALPEGEVDVLDGGEFEDVDEVGDIGVVIQKNDSREGGRE